jgi:hypothetical protein
MAVGDTRALRRVVLLWSGVGVLLLLAFIATFGAVQRAYYSPSGFVEAFARSIAAHDLRSALSMPGAAPTKAALASAGLPTTASRELLRSDILPTIRDVSVVSDTPGRDGVHAVVVNASADGTPVSATLHVRQTGSVLGVLPLWSFASTPLGVSRITVAHAKDFTVGHHTVSPRAASPGQPAEAFSVSADYLVLPLAPLALEHDSRYVSAGRVLTAPAAGEVTETTVDAQPTAAFTKAVQREVNGFLDECAKQRVLQPAGCPFGAVIDDRVQGDPTWSMVTYPVVRLAPGDTGWTAAPTVGVAHLTATVQSLFDGTVSTRSEDEPFSMKLSSVVIRPDGSLSIVVAQDP